MEEIKLYFPDLTSKQIQQFESLLALYEDWNGKINVISRKDLDSFYTRHVLHSLAIAKVMSFKKGTKILDVGTGGGFPAIPLAILFPAVQFLAVDSIGKKIKVVNEVAQSLNLTNIKAEHIRAELIDDKFDFIISRAVTRAANFIPWVNRKVLAKSFNSKKNGFLFLKGGDLTEELAEVKMKYQEYQISKFFEANFFETKKVIYIAN